MMDITRRGFAAGLVAAPAVATSIAPVCAVAATGVALPPPVAQVRIGRFEVTVIGDGYADFPLGWFTGVPEVEMAAAATSAYAGTGKTLRCGFNVWLINDGERMVLVDAGPAGTVAPSTGWLPEALAVLSVSPATIDVLVLTHLHVDHVAGAVAGGTRVFANAEVFVDRRDMGYFGDMANAAAAPDFLGSSFAVTDDLKRLYPGIQQTDSANREILPGLSLVDLSGHTPGQIGVRVEDDGESLLLVSDMLFHPATHPARPDIGFVFEMDKPAADARRARFFAEAAASGTLIAATHMPFPGLGRIVRDGAGFDWVPALWTYGA